jgi:predicted TPR repeat methyltransferase
MSNGSEPSLRRSARAMARRVLDLGCGEGRLIRALLEDRSFEKIVGADVSYRTLEIAEARSLPRARER